MRCVSPRYACNVSAVDESRSFVRTPLGYKHLFRDVHISAREHRVAAAYDWVVAVRNPCSWADGMYRKPHHRCPNPCDRTCCCHSARLDTVCLGVPARVLRCLAAAGAPLLCAFADRAGYSPSPATCVTAVVAGAPMRGCLRVLKRPTVYTRPSSCPCNI